jgi:hypothetical protein
VEDDTDFEDPERLRALLPRLAKDIEAANASRQQQRRQNNGNAESKFSASRIIAKVGPAGVDCIAVWRLIIDPW